MNSINIQLQEKGTTLKKGGEHHVLMEIWSRMELNAEKHAITWKYPKNPSKVEMFATKILEDIATKMDTMELEHPWFVLVQVPQHLPQHLNLILRFVLQSSKYGGNQRGT